MSEQNEQSEQKQSEPYVDPNSGAAPQPGGFVTTMGETPQAETETDAVLEADKEHSAAPLGDQPGEHGDPGFGGAAEDDDPEAAQPQPGDQEGASDGASEGAQPQSGASEKAEEKKPRNRRSGR